MIGHILTLFLVCFTVAAEPGRILDADTFDAKLHIWLGLYVFERIRVLGVDAPELEGATLAAGQAAKAFTQAWLAKGDVTVTVCKRDHFGRLLGIVKRDGQDLARDLIAAGHGVAR